MNWNLNTITALAEVLSAIGVIVSLFYLAIQIRINNKEARMAAMHEIAEGFRNSLSTFTNAEMTGVATRGNEDFDALSDAEIMQLIAGYQIMFRVWEEAFVENNAGRLDPVVWDVITSEYASFLSSPSFNRIWVMRRDFFSTEFQTFVDKLVKTEYKIR